ncbi:hypothetical protein VNO78_39633 [Psophocarpus tetragonolobus]|uniref:Uncharacterized protein n=1 Tax=Psophocarpus tetragonolobus TaxID=3891 RepID=A0AAN9R7N3_PSOTE
MSEQAWKNRIAPTPVAFVIGLLNCVSIERQGGTAAPKGVVTSSMSPQIPDMLWCPGVGRSGSSPYRRGATAASGSDLSTRQFIR